MLTGSNPFSFEFFDRAVNYTGQFLTSGHSGITRGTSSIIPILQDPISPGDYQFLGYIYNLEPIYVQLFEIKAILLTILVLYALFFARSILYYFINSTKDAKKE